jgi:uncharacterized delta-60 repeat protein
MQPLPLDSRLTLTSPRSAARLAAAGLSLLFSATAAQAQISADPSFGIGGASFAANSLWQRAAVQPDGALIVVGSRNFDILVTRYRADGSLDTGFGNGGSVTIDFAGRSEGGSAAAVMADGRIVVAGVSMGPLTELTLGGLPARGYYTDVAVVRLLPNGALDSTFGNGGRLLADFSSGFSDEVAAVFALPGGELRVVGTAQTPVGRGLFTDIGVFAITPAGTVDLAFGSGGAVRVDFGTPPEVRRGHSATDAMLVGNQLVIAGTYRGLPIRGMPGGTALAAARLNAATGIADAGFGVNGTTVVGFATPAGFAPQDELQVAASSLAMQADGSIIVAGGGSVLIGGDDYPEAIGRPYAIRLTPGGQRDPSFNAFPNGSGGGLFTGARLAIAGDRAAVQMGQRLFPMAADGALGPDYGPLVPFTRSWLAQGTWLINVGDAGTEYVSVLTGGLSRFVLDGSVQPPAPPAQVGFQLPPREPGWPFISRVAGTSVQFQWPDQSSNEQFFVVERSLSPYFTNPRRFTLAAGTTQFTDTGLARRTTYHYRLFAENPAGASTPRIFSARTSWR